MNKRGMVIPVACAAIAVLASCGSDDGASSTATEEPTSTTEPAAADFSGEWEATLSYEDWEPSTATVDLEPRIRSMTIELGDCPTVIANELKPGVEASPNPDEWVADPSEGECIGSFEFEYSTGTVSGVPLMQTEDGAVTASYSTLITCIDTATGAPSDAQLKDGTVWTIDVSGAPDTLTGEIADEATVVPDPNPFCHLDPASVATGTESFEAVPA